MKNHSNFRKILAIVLCLSLAFGLVQMPEIGSTTRVHAEPGGAEGIKYLDENGVEQTCTAYTLVTPNMLYTLTDTSNNGYYVVNGEVNLRELKIDGNVKLILSDGAKLNINRYGIHFNGNKSLTIFGFSREENTMGELNITGSINESVNSLLGGYDNSINGYPGMACNVIINGGKINVLGTDRSYAVSGQNCNIVINDGIVTIHGTTQKAAINCMPEYQSDNRISINGGKVKIDGDISRYQVGNMPNNLSLTLGWKHGDDYIDFQGNIDATSISFADNKPFVYDNDKTSATTDSLANKKIIPSACTFVLDKNDGTSVTPEYKNIIYGSTYEDLPTPIWGTNQFVGWFDAATGGSIIVSTNTMNSYGTKTLYAHWTHVHDYSYSLNSTGDVITAACGNGGCPVTTPPTLTLNAPDASSLTFSNSAKQATASPNASWTTANGLPAVPEIKYYSVETAGTKTGGTLLSGGAPVNAGHYYATITVGSGAGANTAAVSFSITKADNAAPTGVGAANETVYGYSDGKITGVDSTMEYKAGTDTDYTPVPVGITTIENLAPGTYKVRYKENGNYKPSEDVEITIDEGVIPVDSVSLDKTAVKVGIGKTVQLSETVLPANATNGNVIWSSNRTDIATVEDGLITGIKAGTAVITVKSDYDNTKKKDVIVMVEPAVKTGLIYNGTEQNLVEIGEAQRGTLLFAVTAKGAEAPSADKYTTDFPTCKEAGEYTVYYKPVTTDNSITLSGNADVAISPKETDKAVIELLEEKYVYDGKAKEPKVTVKDGDIVISPEEYTVDYSSNIDAGTAIVTIKDKTGGNYTVNGTKQFVISKAAQKVPQLTYTDETVAGKNDGTITGLTTAMEISATGKDNDYHPVTEATITGTQYAPGTYYVRYAADKNHEASEPAVITIEKGADPESDDPDPETPSGYTNKYVYAYNVGNQPKTTNNTTDSNNKTEKTVNNPDGSVSKITTVKNPDNSVTTVTETTGKDNKVTKTTETVKKYPSGGVKTDTKTEYPDGTVKTEKKTEYSSGTKTYTSTTQNADGSNSKTYIRETAAGKKTEKQYIFDAEGNGTYSVTNSNKNGVTFSESFDITGTDAVITSFFTNKKKATVPKTILVAGIERFITGIAKGAFKDNTSITNVRVEADITTIGSNAFAGAVNLKKLFLPATLTKIGKNAFTGIPKLTIYIKAEDKKAYEEAAKTLKRLLKKAGIDSDIITIKREK